MSNIQSNWFWAWKWWLTETKRLILLINLPKIYTHTALYRYIFGCTVCILAVERKHCHCFHRVVWIICLLSIDRLSQWNHITQKAAAVPAKSNNKNKNKTHSHTSTFHHAKLSYYRMDRYESVCPIQPQSVLLLLFNYYYLFEGVNVFRYNKQHLCVYLFVCLFKDVHCTRL